MFNTKFLGKRKYAVYKQDGTPWTQKEYTTVANLFEKHGSNQKCLDFDILVRKYISDKINEDSPMYYLWYDQQKEQDLKSFTKISYEELLKQSKLKILKRKVLWNSK